MATEREIQHNALMSLLLSDHPRDMGPPPHWSRRIGCAGCGCVATFQAADGWTSYDRMGLWRLGWRRDPDTALDYCPRCHLARNPGGG